LLRVDARFEAELAALKELVRAGEWRGALAGLRRLAAPLDDLARQHRYLRLFAALPVTELELEPIRVAVCAHSSVEHLTDLLRLWLALDGFDARIFAAPFGTVDQMVLDPGSELYRFQPDVIWLFSSHRDVSAELPPGVSLADVDAHVAGEVQRFADRWQILRQHSTAHLVQNNADLPLLRPFGNFEGSAPFPRATVLRDFNVRLARSAAAGVTIFDLDALSSVYGKRTWVDERFWHHSRHAFSLDALGLVAFHLARLVRGLRGRAARCVVVDLDGTLWGGTIGDDGVEGIALGDGEGEPFVAFQEYLLKLKERGILLAVASKNQPETARLPFTAHPAMKLRLDDFAMFAANWRDKPDNLREIARGLNLHLSSLVFVDDNPVERERMRQALPMVDTVELPADPARYARALDGGARFETMAHSAEDIARHGMYRDNAEREALRERCGDLAQFLQQLSQQAAVIDVDDKSRPRVAQLVNKSNQFHLTTTRYSEAQLAAITGDPRVVCRAVRLRDRFGDNGIISAVILRSTSTGGDDLEIDTWVMSCRVLLRGVEELLLAELAALGRARGAQRLVGRYLPTARNGLVAELYPRLGFSLVDREGGATRWALPLDGNLQLPRHHIERVEAW
jgi:FkbH-like protein